MTANTPEDAALKVGIIDDVMTAINVEGVYLGCYTVSRKKRKRKQLEGLTSFSTEKM